MNFEDLVNLYKIKKEQFGQDTYKHISGILDEAKEIHRKDWEKNPTPKGDHEQSWRAFKGKNFEKLIQYIIQDEVEDLGLKVVNGNILERKCNLSDELSRVKRNLSIDYGQFGLHLPDVDIVIYSPINYDILAIISSKVTLRERIAQTGYWKLKLKDDVATKDIKVYFVTLDEDKTLSELKPAKKGRAIVETDLDGSYILTQEYIVESEKVKLFEHFIEDLKRLLKV
ncbi:MAG: BsaWI family type II restriction enzyme [Candidatus Cloacimonadaceae bacterium]|jgi:type II restriction enzyme|nr:BsaWI family type II restriction enzyme [Candidatus Cloacimonadota bacterium]MDY0112194.1 BsaWI family type II restriction enzyme [Candidatus Syntrophosphaera sp.]